MAIRIDFKRRLQDLAIEIDRALYYDSVNRGLLPALFSVFRYMWCKSSKTDIYDKFLDF